MAFSYIIKSNDTYLSLITDEQQVSDTSWHMVKDRSKALIMSLDYAEIMLAQVNEYVPSAQIYGGDYEQN